MNCFYCCSAAVLSSTGHFVIRSWFCGVSTSLWRSSFENAGIRYKLNGFHIQWYSSGRTTEKKTNFWKLAAKAVMEEEKDAFFVVRKGDIVGIYKNLSDCQAQVGSSICDPPVSVYKGHSLPEKTKRYLMSCGLKNALYSIRAEDLSEELFGTLIPCPFQEPTSSQSETSRVDMQRKRSQEVVESEAWGGLISNANNPFLEHIKLDHDVEAEVLYAGLSCILEFDGASKGNPGQAGAGAVLRAVSGSVAVQICRLQEGLGTATCNVAEYRAFILGLRYALRKGFTSIHVQGDSKLVCMQIQGLWKVRNENISILYEEAKKLKDKFLSFQINHVLRGRNSEADAQANLAVDLAVGQVHEEAFI